MAPNDVDVPRAVSLDYFHESVQKSIINGSDIATLGSTCKSNFQCPPGEVYASDTRCIEIPRADLRLHVRFLYHPPRMISMIGHRLFGSDHALDLWPELRKSPIFTKFQ